MNILKKLRIDRGVTQFTMSRAIGISEPKISKIETNRQMCDDDLIVKIAGYFQVSEELLKQEIGEIELIETEVKIKFSNPNWVGEKAYIVSAVQGGRETNRALMIQGNVRPWMSLDLKTGEGWDGSNRVFLDLESEWKGKISYDTGDSSRFEVIR